MMSKSEIHVVLSCNNAYSCYARNTIQSIKNQGNVDRKYVFHIIFSELSNNYRKMFEKSAELIYFHKIDKVIFDNMKIFSKEDECGHITVETYYRFKIPDILPHQKKALYLDCDVLANSSIDELWDIDISGHSVAAVRELGMSRYPSNHLEKHGVEVSTYFNAGVLLINLEYWRKHDITKKLFCSSIKIREDIKFVDQDVLNYTLKDSKLLVEDKYNFQETGYHKKDRKPDLEYPVIVHYLGKSKPWSPKGKNKYFILYKKYLRTEDFIKISLEALLSSIIKLVNFIIYYHNSRNSIIIKVFSISIYRHKKKIKNTVHPKRETL